jgi:hypothetical protein
MSCGIANARPNPLTPLPGREGGEMKVSNVTCYNAGNQRNAVTPACRTEVF